ncbi:MAG: efflux RND transporter periplasmic adaptor subunit [Armatimonadota bacterium]
MSSAIRWILIIGVIAAVVGGGFAFANKGGKEKQAVTYEFGTAAVGDVKSFVTATGVVQAWKTVDVKSNVSGRIDRLYVDLGDTVTAGQRIMDIDPTDTRTAYEQADADRRAAQARLAQAVSNLKQQKLQTNARIAASRQAVASARARLAQARANMEAQPKLTDSNIAQARASLASAKKAVTQTEKSIAQLQQSLAQLKEVTIPLNVETVESNVRQADANMDIARRAYDRQRKLHSQGYLARSEVEAAYARFESMKASYEQAKQRKDTLQRENRLAIQEMEARVDEARARLEADQAREQQAQAGLTLAQTNAVQNDVRAKEHDAALAAVAQAEQDLKSAQAEREQIDVRDREIVAAKAQIVRSDASVNQAETNLGFTKVTAPRTGVIIAKQVEEGTVVPSSRASIGSTNYLLQIGDVSRLWIKCNVDETDIGQVATGQRVDVRVDAYPDVVVSGRVIRIDPQAIIEQNVTLIPVTVELSRPDARFKPGMNATCEFITDEARKVLTLPNEGVKEGEEGGYYVEKLVNGAPQKFEIVVGVVGQDTTEIVSGIKDGDEVITRTIQPEAEEANNPFNPFNRFGGNRNQQRGRPGGGGPGGAGNRPGGGGGGAPRGGGR